MSVPSHDSQPFQIDEPPVAGENEKALAGLAYASQLLLPLVLPIVLLLSDETRRSTFLRYHAVHAVALAILAVLFDLVAAIIMVVTGVIAPCLLGLLWVLFLLPAVPLLVYGWQAYQGRMSEIPWLTSFLRSNRWL